MDPEEAATLQVEDAEAGIRLLVDPTAWRAAAKGGAVLEEP